MTRFRFTIRSLFLLTLIVAVSLAWWVDHRRRIAERDALIRALMIAIDTKPVVDFRSVLPKPTQTEKTSAN